MKTYYYPSKSAQKRVQSILNRNPGFKKKDLRDVSRIIENVRKYGDKALIEYTNRFDAPELGIESLRVTEEESKAAFPAIENSFTGSLDKAIKQIKKFHRLQKSKSWISTERPGTILGQLVNPVDTAGIYVPGGKSGQTPLVSSVLMGAIPAVIAGVKKIIMATPPREDGTLNPHLVVAAKKAGVHNIYKIGSAWAIAALAYGTESVPMADVIVGPGNIYVTLAKKIVSGRTGIDMIAGPSEILIIADETAIPEFIAADLLSQAEHDPLASSILVTDSRKKAKAVVRAVKDQITNLQRFEIAKASIAKFGTVIVVPDLDTAIELANRIAPEHLELHIKDPFEHIGRIRNAGALFVGNYTPEPVGDYIAGPNHVLPTAGTARYASALSVDHFIKKTSLIHYSQEAFMGEAGDIIRLAEIEGLDAHAKAVKIRM
ncbi:MAG: histidinol dehydrogenase [Desulfosarcina sp.]|nr:histidinol dehydrogenase [Desulfobacterales bacterium]